MGKFFLLSVLAGAGAAGAYFAWSIGFPAPEGTATISLYLARVLSLESLLCFGLAVLKIAKGRRVFCVTIYGVVSVVIAGFLWGVAVDLDERVIDFLEAKVELAGLEQRMENQRKAQLNDPEFTIIDRSPSLLKTLRASIHFDVSPAEYRERLIQEVWRRRQIPFDRFPDWIQTDVSKSPVEQSPYVERVMGLTIDMPFGFQSKAKFFLPKIERNILAVYHQGHHPGGFEQGGKKAIEAFLAEGYAVLALSMPGSGENTTPEKVLLEETGRYWSAPERLTPVKLHNALADLETDEFSPLQYFFEPVVAGLNYALRDYNYDQVIMTGISGGGWLTTVYAAMDKRIDQSYPVAGSLPKEILLLPPNSVGGDYEQMHPLLMDEIGYLRMYVLGGIGTGRKQHQILHQYDSCCFKGRKAEIYEDIVKQTVKEVGADGEFNLTILPQFKHTISLEVLRVITEDVNTEASYSSN